MAMILTESGFITQSENKPESMFKVGDLIRPTLNNQFDGMSTDEIWEVVEVNGYDRMNGYVYTIKPNNDAAKAYRSENSTDGEAEGFAEIAGFENSPEEQAWTLAESKSIKEDAFDYDENSEKDQLIWDHLSMKFADVCKEILGIDSEVVPEQEWITLINTLVRINKMTNSGEYAESLTQNTSKDIDTLLDAAGGVEEARMGIAMTLQNHPDMDEEELAEFLADDEISYEEWLSIIEYLGTDID